MDPIQKSSLISPCPTPSLQSSDADNSLPPIFYAFYALLCVMRGMLSLCGLWVMRLCVVEKGDVVSE